MRNVVQYVKHRFARSIGCSQDTNEINVAISKLPQDVKSTCYSEIDVIKCQLSAVDGGNVDTLSRSTRSSEETSIQVNYFNLAFAN